VYFSDHFCGCLGTIYCTVHFGVVKLSVHVIVNFEINASDFILFVIAEVTGFN